MPTTVVDDYGRVTEIETPAEKRQAEIRTAEGEKKLYEQTKLYQQGKLDTAHIRDMQETFKMLGAKFETTTANGGKETKTVEVTGKKDTVTDGIAGGFAKIYEEKHPAAQAPSQADVRKADKADNEAVAKKQEAKAPAEAKASAVAKPVIPFKGEDLVMQAQLRMLGQSDVGPIDGRKGPLTEAAIGTFAKKNGLEGKDEKTIRDKIAEQFTALKLTPDKINGLVSSNDPNDVKAGQVAYNLQHPDAMVKVTGVKDEATSAALVAVARAAGAAVPQTTTTQAPPAGQQPQQAQSHLPSPGQQTQQQQTQPNGLQSRLPATDPRSPDYGRGQPQQGQAMTPEQTIASQQQYIQQQQQMIQQLQAQGAPRNIAMGQPGTLTPYYNAQAAQQAGWGAYMAPSSNQAAYGARNTQGMVTGAVRTNEIVQTSDSRTLAADARSLGQVANVLNSTTRNTLGTVNQIMRFFH
jgi:hypothetical protein